MREITFTNPRTGTEYVRISKSKARKIFIQGGTLIVAPCNMRLFTNWGGWHLIDGYNSEIDYIGDTNKSVDEIRNIRFNQIVNSIVYYNCNNEMGNYPSFYVVKSKVA